MCVNNKKEEGERERERWEIRDESNLSVSDGVDVERRWVPGRGMEGGFVGVCAMRRRRRRGETLKGMSQPGACCVSFNINKAPTSRPVYPRDTL